MRFYEVVTPLRTQLTQLSEQKLYLTEELDLHRTKMKDLMEVQDTSPRPYYTSVLFFSYPGVSKSHALLQLSTYWLDVFFF